MEDPLDTADALRRAIPAPDKSLHVWVWDRGYGAIVLVVRVLPGYNIARDRIPKTFRGYMVIFEI